MRASAKISNAVCASARCYVCQEQGEKMYSGARFVALRDLCVDGVMTALLETRVDSEDPHWQYSTAS